MSQKREPAHACIDHNLLAFIAHETRGPFNGLIGFSELLHTNQVALTAEQRETYSELVHQLAVKSFLQLQTLIVWVKLISGNLTIHSGCISLKEWIHQVNSSLEIDFKAKNIPLNTTLTSFDLNGDLQLLSIGLANLLYTTLRFADEHSEMRIDCSDTNRSISISSKYSKELDTLINEIIRDPQGCEQSEQNFRIWIAYHIFNLNNIHLQVAPTSDNRELIMTMIFSV